MAIFITFGATCDFNQNVIKPLGATSISLSGSTANAGAVAPAGTTIASLYSTEAAHYNIGAAASTSTHYIGANERIPIQCGVGAVIAGIQAA